MPKDGKRNFLSSMDRGRSHDVNRDQERKGHSQTIGHRWRDNSGYQEKVREKDGVTTLSCKSIFFKPLQSQTMAHNRPLPKIESSNSGGMHGKWRAHSGPPPTCLPALTAFMPTLVSIVHCLHLQPDNQCCCHHHMPMSHTHTLREDT